MEKIKILYLIDKLTAAGTQSNLLETVRRLDRERFEPHVIALTGGGNLVAEFRSEGIEPEIFSVKRVYGPSGWAALFKLVRYIRMRRIEILQLHFLHADILGTLAARITGARVITARRDEGFWRSKRHAFINRILNRWADVILCNCDAVLRATQRVEEPEASKLRVIRNGVDTGRFIQDKSRQTVREKIRAGSDDLLIGVVANMKHAVKGQIFLINALHYISNQVPNVKVVFIGDGPLKVSLKEEAVRLAVRDRCLFLGSRRDIPALVSAMDILCLPSLSEGLSNSLLEYMAAGKPVVATRVGGNGEVLLNGSTGFLVKPADAMDLADKLLTLLKDPELRARFGQAARERIYQKFTLARMIREYETLYEELAGRKKKVLYMIWSLDLGGAEQVVINLARKLDRKRFEPVVCCLNAKGRYAQRVESLGIKVLELKKRPKFDPFLIPKLIGVIKREKIQLVHTHLFTANFWGRLAGRIAGVPVVSTEHNMDTWKKPLHFNLDRALTHVNKRIIFVSRKVQDFYRQKLRFDGKGRVLYNGIDVARFEQPIDKEELRVRLGIPAGKRVVGIAGRLVAAKAHVDFLEALLLVVQSGVNVTGLIVGDGELRGQLENRVREMGLQDDVIFTGFRTDMPELYHVMDVFTLSSLREGFPMTILESMAAGTPVVSTSVGGVPECINDGVDGLLVTPGDAVALSDAISSLLNDETKRQSIIENARAKVRTLFSIEHMVREHEVLYQEVLES